MKRPHTIIVLTVVLCILCAVLPLAGMMHLAWLRAVRVEQENLAGYAQTATLRASRALNEIRIALRALEPLALASCSDQHIARMRQLTVNTRSIEQIGYFEHGVLQCTSWGRVTGHSARPPADFTLGGDLQVNLQVLPAVANGMPMVAFQYHAHNALTAPARLVDISAEAGMQLIIASDDGHVLGLLNQPDPAVVRRLLAHPVNSIDEQHLAGVARQDGLLAIALVPREHLSTRLHKEQLMLAPVGMMAGGVLIALLLWAVRRRLSPLGELAQAVRRHEFVVHYQPILDLNTGHCVGAEALVRWQRGDGSIVRPDQFIPLAEESGLVLPITDQVIASVVRDIGALLVTDRRLHIAVNLSAADIKSGRALGVIERALADTGIATSQIWLEATERGFMDVNAARATLDKARGTGHAIAIDDFGTGYSSLSSLQNLPLDALKIDKSFVDTIGTDLATSSVTPHIIDMAKTLGLKIVAEGVETAQQADYLRNHQVDYAQGWLFAKAMPAAQFIVYCQEHRAPSAKVLATDATDAADATRKHPAEKSGISDS